MISEYWFAPCACRQACHGHGVWHMTRCMEMQLQSYKKTSVPTRQHALQDTSSRKQTASAYGNAAYTAHSYGMKDHIHATAHAVGMWHKAMYYSINGRIKRQKIPLWEPQQNASHNYLINNTLLNGPFWLVIWAVWQCEMGHFAKPSGRDTFTGQFIFTAPRVIHRPRKSLMRYISPRNVSSTAMAIHTPRSP